MIYLYLLKEFILIGCLAFSGGMVVLPFIQNISSQTGLISQEQIIEMVAISEITPGPLAVNMATYVGYIIKGIPGGIITTFALIFPQIFIIFFVYKLFKKSKDNENVKLVLKGARPVSLALTIGAGLSIINDTFINKIDNININNIVNILNWKCLLIGIIVLIAIRKKKLHPIFYFVICGFAGVIFGL